jgi:phosphoribosylformylglycinamidine synthase subunit PurS
VKATILVRLKAEVLDPQGEAVRKALVRLGFQGVKGVRMGKLVEIDLDGEPTDEVRKKLAKMADEILANPVIEDYELKA